MALVASGGACRLWLFLLNSWLGVGDEGRSWCLRPPMPLASAKGVFALSILTCPLILLSSYIG